MAGNEAVLLAQADSACGEGRRETEAKAEAKPEAKADAKTGSEDRRESRRRKPKPKPRPKPKRSRRTKPESQGLTVDPRQPMRLRQQPFQATLTLSSTVAKLKDGKVTQVEQPVRYDEDRLKKLVEQALEENKIPVDQVRIELTAPDG